MGHIRYSLCFISLHPNLITNNKFCFFVIFRNGTSLTTTESSTTTTTSIPAMSINKDSTTGPLLPVMQNSMHYVQTQSSNPSRYSTSFNHPSMYSSHFSSPRFTISSKQCQEKCSWRCSTIILVIILILMCAILGYFTGM